MSPLFSVIIPTYNRAGIIGAALGSVLNQTFTDYEVIVVDDGSKDETVAVTKAIAERSDRSIRVVEQPNAGPGAARNTGIAQANGEYVALLDSDDLWFPWTLKNFHEILKKFNDPEFLCGVPVDVKQDDPIVADGNQPITAEQYADFYSVPGNPFFRFTTSGVVIRKTALQQVGGFAGERINYEDLDLWMRLGTQRGFILITNPPQVVRRFLGDNISASRDHNIRGATFMIDSEKAGKYPGGVDRQTARRRLLTVLMRAASVQMARSRDYRSAFSIYFQILPWSLAQWRFRYILGFPLQAISSLMGKK
jgi:glycosyltransferase involved in cell wall biosynthesis